MLRLTRLLFAVTVFGLATPVFGQEQQLDPRLAGPALKAMQAELDLREAYIRTLRDDYEAQKATLIEWLKEAQKK